MAAEHVERIGARIRQRREELGLSRGEVARQMPGKTNENAIYRWEKGLHQANPDALEALAGVLDVNTSYFYVDAPERDEALDRSASVNGSTPGGNEAVQLQTELAEIKQGLADLATQLDAIMEATESTHVLSETKFAELLRAMARPRRQAG